MHGGEVALVGERSARAGAALDSAVFALTVFCGAFFLFLVEPIIAKELLPWFGGAANVWATCLVFFQLGLLLGYGYADVLAWRLSGRAQPLVLLILLAAAALTLPIVPAAHWKAAGPASPSLAVLGALATTVGLPYMLMAATSPLVQSWYARRFPERSPYRLFALSNLASMLALIVYPTVLEPWLGTRLQTYLWSAGYVLWAVLLLACAASVRGLPRTPTPPRVEAPDLSGSPVRSYLEWLVLAALGSFLLVAVTNHMTRDVAAIPLLWVVPLAIYLLTFIVSFQRGRDWSPRVLLAAGGLALLVYAAYAAYTNWPGETDTTPTIGVQLACLAIILAAACLFCHGRLALTRPAPRELTRYYLVIALGGALGSTLIGLAAPALLRVDFDLEIGMLACAVVVLRHTRRQGRAALTLAAIMALAVLGAEWLVVREYYDETVLTRRNFYGTLRVQQWQAGKAGIGRSLSNGAILHGTQFSAPDAVRRPTEYYAPSSGVGLALQLLQRRPEAHRIGVIGLGVGTLAAYGRSGDVVRFYEINPAVLEIARHEFTYLKDSPARIEVALGDARLSMEREPAQRLDLLAVDAFSSDAIPVHLLTREAIAVYLRHLKPDGVLAIHTSNRYLDLPPVVARVGLTQGLVARLIEDDTSDQFVTPSGWVLLARDASYFNSPEFADAEVVAPVATRAWSDDFSGLLPVVRWRHDE
jgi:SAM-dependent methyltransferase